MCVYIKYVHEQNEVITCKLTAAVASTSSMLRPSLESSVLYLQHDQDGQMVCTNKLVSIR